MKFALFGFLALFAFEASAEFRLPNGKQREPNISADPFERARKPKTAPPTRSEGTKTPETSAPTESSPPPPPSPVTPKASTGKSALSHEFIADLDYVYKLQGGVTNGGMAMSNGTGTTAEPTDTPPQSVIVGLLHYIGEFDPKATGLWDNGHFLTHIIYGYGQSPTVTVGDLRSVSNVDASFMNEDDVMVMPGLDLVELWYQHEFSYSKTNMRVGVLSYGFEFYKTRYSGIFLHSAFGIGTEVLWDTMVSNPPTTSVGARVKTEIQPNVYLQLGIYDGFPDHSTNFFDLKLSKEEGFFMGTELILTQGKPKTSGYFKYGVGAWYLRQDMEKFGMVGFANYEGPFITGTTGYYLFAEKAFSDQLGVFIKGGRAADDVNKYSAYYSGGVWYKGLFGSRPNDTAGVGVAQSQLGDTYMALNGADESGESILYTSETIVEFAYSIPINDWLTVQPDVQYIDNPSFSVMNEDAWVAMVRAEAVF